MNDPYTDVLAVWPDGFWCRRDEIEERMRTGSSDDYALLTVPGYILEDEDKLDTFISKHNSHAFSTHALPKCDSELLAKKVYSLALEGTHSDASLTVEEEAALDALVEKYDNEAKSNGD